MAKLNKNPQIQKAVEYLQLNGFNADESLVTGIHLKKDDKAVVIYGNSISFRTLAFNGDDAEYIQYLCIDGTDSFSETDFIYLFHIAKVIPLSRFASNVKKANMTTLIDGFFGNIQKASRHAITLFICCLLYITSQAQAYAGMSLGMAGTKQPVISPSVGLNIRRFIIQGDMIAFTNQDQPAIFGLRAGYKFPYVQASIGRYYSVYSLDKYDMQRNGWVNGYFLKVYKNKLGIEYGYMSRSMFTISFTENIGG